MNQENRRMLCTLDRIRVDAEAKRRTETLEAIRKHGGNLAAVARELGMSRGGVIYRVKKYGLLEEPKEENRWADRICRPA